MSLTPTLDSCDHNIQHFPKFRKAAINLLFGYSLVKSIDEDLVIVIVSAY